MELQDAIKKIFEGNSLLFTGAGFSLSATNMNNVNFKSAYYLAENLYNECGEVNDGDLENAVDIFLDKYGEIKLIEFLKNEFTVQSIPDELKVFGTINWKRIYTTNYDNVIETAYQNAGKVLTPVTLSNRATDYDKQDICVHLNGDITNLNQSTLNNEFKLTNVSYLTQAFLESEWLNLFAMDLATADSIFFVGFSLKYDLDIKRLIYANPELKEKTFFIVSKDEKVNNIRLISKFGTPIPIGVLEFSQKIIQEKKVFIPPISKIEHYFSFNKVEGTSKKLLPNIKDSDIRSLFVDGISNDYLLQFSLQLPKEYPYYIFRNKFENIVERIESGEKNFVLHSDMGNGKSLFLDGLKHYLYKKGFTVYQYYKFYSPIYRELEKICTERNDKTVLIIDNYTTDWQLLDVLKLHRKDLIFITTERTLVFDVTSERLESNIGDYTVYDINYLESEEIDSIIEIFSKYGFWQDFSSKPDYIKRKFIENTCKKEFRTLLLKLLDSPDILQRFEKIISDIKSKKGYYNAFVFILISNVYGFDLDLENLAYTLGYDVINNSSFIKNQQIREFIDLERGTISIKSPILSTIILSKVVDSVVLVDTILSVFTKLDKHHTQKPYKNILRSFVSFSNLQRILDKTDRSYKFNMLRFFEGIRNTNFCRENPHFWLQYAIEKLSERDYTSANTYFRTAYSYANSKTGYDTYQIDNHYARYILEFSIESGNKEECLDDFKKAHNILMDPLHEKVVKYYPFRVAQNYLPFYEKFYSDFNEAQKKIFIKACEEILEKIERYVRNVPKYSKSKDVITARANFNYILSQSSD